MQISLGMAKIDMKYGINSKKKIINNKRLSEIFLFLKKKKIKSLDISPLYGNLINRIKKFDLKKLDITYKIYVDKKNFSKIKIHDQVTSDLLILNLRKFDTILIHNAHEINKKKLNKTISIIEELKKVGLVKKIGLSIYTKKEYQKVSNKKKIDVIQIPLNIFDQRLLQDNWLSKESKKRNIEIQVRSVFLQGLLLCDIKKFKKNFLKKNPIIKKWNNLCNNQLNNKLMNTINFIKNQKYIKKIIVGFEDLNQLRESYKIIKNSPKKINYSNFSSKSLNLIDPRKWNRDKILINK